ncbi:N-acetylglucosamine-6-phosphate deacetylase [Phocoenobacter atlanticus]|uniref:N-acetylglucosamine-6-phosphate deacetylase n=1 Tax=Phocoenobacter atlanticus TaxID=3416742 RepID=UPI002769BEB9|nr:N-acetylglucosamine-6-phosphate deacetylase [Pasteurella atlantica]MDP8101786.1 N-acetylglucosamine-6-phosphate deacetylase [Pasteurella atlantica]
MIYYQNAAIFDGNNLLYGHSLAVEGDRTIAVIPNENVPQDAKIIQLKGGILTPGYVELQANGGGGVLFNDEPNIEGLKTIIAAHRKFGTVAILPTFITDTPEKLEQGLAAIQEGIKQNLHGLIGGHFEGPFISLEKKGTHQPAYIRKPTKEDYDRYAKEGLGNSLVTVAPEQVPADFIKHLVDHGFKVNAGHTMAQKEDMLRAYSMGLSGVTHLYNAMPPLQGREPAVIGTACTLGLYCGVIVDGVHSDPFSLKTAYKLLGKDRLHLVTDSMHTIGVEGIESFDLMGQKVFVQGNKLVNENGSLAGAHITMEQNVKNALKFMQASVVDVLTMAITTPAKHIGREDLATIINREMCDILYLDDELSLQELPS